MEIKKIIGLCKKSGTLRMFLNEGAQWISDGYALYPLFDFPIFNEENICKCYDISAKKAEKMHISFSYDLPQAFDYRDNTEDETQCVRGAPIFGGLVPITTSQGLEFIQSKYLTPFADCDDAMLYVFERTNATGTRYFVIKDGYMLVAIVLPYDCINEGFVKRLKDICEQCEISLFNKQQNGATDEMEEADK